MDKHYVDENNLVELYVRGDLQGADLTAFEIFLLDHPAYVDEIAVAEQLRNTLKQEHQTFFDNENRETVRPSRPAYALAASLLLGLSLMASGYFYVQNNALRSQLTTLNGPKILTQEVWLEQSRNLQGVRIQIDPSSALLLRLDVSEHPALPIDVDLQGEQLHWQHTTVADQNNSVSLYLPQLQAGEYTLRLTPANGPGQEGRVYRFTLAE